MTQAPIGHSEIIIAILRNDLPALQRALGETNWDTSEPEPLFRSAECKPEIVELLLRHGWNPNVHDRQFRTTPLMKAAHAGNAEVVAVLLRGGADISLVDKNGHGALLHSVDDRSSGHQRSMELLLDAGMDVNPGGNVSPLMNATAYATPQMVETLINRGADVRRIYPTGTALTWAIEANRPEMAGLLLRYGANPNDQLSNAVGDSRSGWRGLTAIEIARREKRTKIVKLFETFLISGQAQPAEPLSITDSWCRIESEIETQGESADKWLLPPASSEEFTDVEAWFKRPLPLDVRASWNVHGGQPEGATSFRVQSSFEWIEGESGLFRLFPLSEVIEESNRMQAFADNGAYDGQNIGAESGIQAVPWHKAWLPVAKNLTGDIWCIDLAPMEDGQRGQVILVSSESAIRSRIAESWRELLAKVDVIIS